MAEVIVTFNGQPGRRCIGSKSFAIEPHDAPVADFPVQPSQKDGLGRMCKPHWTEYTRALRQAALARKATAAEPVAANGTAAEPVAEFVAAKLAGTRRRGAASARDAKPTGQPVPKPAKKAKAARPKATRIRLSGGGWTVDEEAEAAAAAQEVAAD